MSTAGASEASTPGPQKSKQERIRDNQRRSRARRQEYLADLERRVRECHITCREAELQRAAFKDLQEENTRLRDLLQSFGATPEYIEAFVHREQTSQQAEALNPLRYLKPKVPSVSSGSHPTPRLSSASVDTSYTLSGNPSPSGMLAHMSSVASPSETSSIAPTSLNARSASLPLLPIPQSPYEWTYGSEYSDVSGDYPGDDSAFICDTFLIPPNGPLLPENGDTILCSAAKQVLDQYSLKPEQMHLVRQRLATGFSKPSFPGTGCRVSRPLLFQTINELGLKIPRQRDK